MDYAIGAALAVAVGLFAALSGFDRDRAFYPTVLIVVAHYYLLFALIGKFVEGMGAVRCGCLDDCWCKRPVLSAFRWVFPWAHHVPPATVA